MVRDATSLIPVLSNVTQFIPPLLVGLKLSTQIPPVQEILQRMERGPGWKWYQAHSTDLDLPANASIKEVLLRLFDYSSPGKPGKQGREYLIGQVLPTAFVADLYDLPKQASDERDLPSDVERARGQAVSIESPLGLMPRYKLCSFFR